MNNSSHFQTEVGIPCPSPRVDAVNDNCAVYSQHCGDGGRFPSNTKGAVLRQGFRVPHDELKSPCKLDEGSTKEQGDTTIDHKQKWKAVLLEKDDASSASSYESRSDIDDRTNGDPVVAAATSQDDTDPILRGPLSPSPSSNGKETREVHSSRVWYEFDLSVMVALASPVGDWLTGGDHRKAQSQLDLLSEKVAMLEAKLTVAKVRLQAISAEIYEHVEVTYDAVDKATRRHEKETEATKSALETRLSSRVEKDVECNWNVADEKSDTVLSEKWPFPLLLYQV
ncbi:hypothetical protein J3A83DRAFT_4198048 [Scleroderma citrinum]